MSGPERRRYVRRNIIESQLLTADLRVKNAHERTQRGIVINVSEGGLALQPFTPLTPGIGGELRLELPGCPQPFAAPGLVAWVGRGGRAGIRFVDLSHSARSLLRSWLLMPADPLLANATLTSPSALAEQKPFEQLDLTSALELVAERARNITGASGAAIALGNSTGMICRASIGSAPDLGAILRPEIGLSGECLRTGKLVRCSDTQSDARVDPVAAARLNVRSIVIVPVRIHDQLAGILQVLSPCADGFADRHISRLERMADLLAAAVVETHPRETADERFPMPAPPAKPPAAKPAEVPPEKLAGSLLAAAERVTAPPSAQVAPEKPRESAAEKPRESDQAKPAVITKPATAEPAVAPTATVEFAPSVSLLETGASSEPRRSAWIILGAIAIVLAVVAIAGYLLYAGAKAPAPAPVTNAGPPVLQPAPTPAAEAAPPPPAADEKPVAKAQAPKLEQRLTMWPENRIRLPGPGSGAPQPPPVLLGTNSAEGNVRVVVSSILISDAKMDAEAAQARLTPGKLVHKVDPVYPDAALGTGIGGDVMLTSRITKEGTVENVKVISGPQLLASAAADAIRRWRYEPYLLDGKPVDVQTTMTVRFAPH